MLSVVGIKFGKASMFRTNMVLMLIGLVCLCFVFIILRGEGGARGGGNEGLSLDIDQNEFEVDNSNGLRTHIFEPDLKITNEHDSNKNITISFSAEIYGDDTGHTSNIWPIIYVSSKDRSNERNGKGNSFKTEIDPGDTIFYLQILTNDSAFADVYRFELRVTNDDDNVAIDPIPMVVIVPEYNNILISFYPDIEEGGKTISAGSMTVLTIKVENRGNIYREEVRVRVFIEPERRLSLQSIIYPPAHSGTINPEFFEVGYEVTVSVYIKSDMNAWNGNYPIQIILETPENDEPAKGHPVLDGNIRVIYGVDPPDENEINRNSYNLDNSEDEDSLYIYFLLEIMIIAIIIPLAFVVNKNFSRSQNDRRKVVRRELTEVAREPKGLVIGVEKRDSSNGSGEGKTNPITGLNDMNGYGVNNKNNYDDQDMRERGHSTIDL